MDARLPLAGFEPHIAIDPTNPQNIAIARYTTVLLSTDGGNTFPTTVNVNLPAGFNQNRGGDPVLAYDSQGNLFFSFLATEAATTRIDVFLQPINHAAGTPTGTAVNVSALAGFGAAAGSDNDKQWLAIDRFPGSPFRDRMYMVWTDFGGANVTVLASFSSDGGVTWSAGQVLTTPAEGFPWPPHVAVAANSDVYAAYHGDANMEIILVRSPFDSPTNSGGNFDLTTKFSVFPANAANLTFNVQGTPPNLDRNRSWTQGSHQPYILPDPTDGTRVLVVASDDPTDANDGAGFDDAGVFMVTTTNRGGTWSAPVQVDAGPGTSHQLFPTGAFDINSQCVSIMYYDSRAGAVNAAGNLLLDVFVRTSPDSGATWLPEVQINDNAFDPDLLAPDRFPPTQTLRIGEYNGLLHARGAVWTGNDPLDPAGTGNQQTIFDYSDGVAPTFTSVPAAITSPTCDVPPIGAATADDNQCGIGGVVVTNDAPVVFLPGTTPVTWIATDAADNVATATQLITVDDQTPPVFVDAALTPFVVRQCDFGAATVTLPIPAATDDCGGTVQVSGTITSSTNPAVAVGTPLVGGTVTLPPGIYTVSWVATDDSGNPSAVLTQTVTIRPALYATDSIFVRENFSDVRLPTSGFASLANSGNGITDVRNDARAGDILSVANVAIGYRATVGNVVSQDSIFWDTNAAPLDRPSIESQSIGPVSLPPPMDLSSIVFPTTPGNVFVSDTSLPPLAPGNYGAYTINSGGELELQGGVYFFERLTINAAGRIVATPETVIYTKGSDRFQGPIVDSTGALVSVFIGFSGTSLNLETNFVGTIVAPNATVRMGTANAQILVTGGIHARVIDLANGADLVCEALPCPSSVCGQTPPAPAPTCSDGMQNGGETGVDCGGPCPNPCPSCNAATYEAELMFHSVGGPTPGGWNVFSNGYASTTHDFTPGLASVRVRALGQQAAGVLPHMVVSVGGTPIGDVSVSASAYTDYDFFFIAPGGPQEVRVAFDNDFLAPPQDRNLFIDNVSVNCGLAFQMAAGLVAFEAESFDASTANGSADVWSATFNGLASSGQAMTLGPENGSIWTSNILTTAPRLDYNVNFPSAGTFFMHVRGDGPNGSGDSCFGGVGSSVNMSHYDFPDTPGSWAWITQSITIASPGIHTVHVWGREDGFSADKVVISTSATPPAGMGPPTSPKG